MDSKILFQEQQKFTQWWLWLILISPVIILFYSLMSSILKHPNHAAGNYSFSVLPSNDFWLSLLIMLFVLLLFLLLNLKTKINQKTFAIQYFPFFSKSWTWDDIETAKLVTYGFVGYGIRISLKYGKVYNVKGNKGAAITLKNGNKYLVGTQKPEELERILLKVKNFN